MRRKRFVYMWFPSFVKKAFHCLLSLLRLELGGRARLLDSNPVHGPSTEGSRSVLAPVKLWLLVLMLGAVAGCESLRSFPGMSSGSQQQTEAVQQQYQSAVDAITQGEYETARALLEELVENHPGLATPYVNLGIIADQQGDQEKALQWYQKALEVDAAQPEALNQLGILYRQKGQLKKALETYRRALAANERLPQIHYNLGILYDLYLGDYSQAVRHYERYQELTGGQNARVQQWIQDLKRRSP